MLGICRTSKGLWNLQPWTTHRHTGKIWCPPIICSAIKCMYNKIIVKLIIGKIDTFIDFKVGVNQRDSIAPVLFLFLTISLVDSPGIKKISIFLQIQSTGQLVSHKPCIFTFFALFHIFCIIYVDYDPFFFESRTNITKGITIFSNHFARFGFKMHIGTRKSIKYWMCILTASRFLQWKTLPLTDLTNSTLFL